MTGPQRPVLVVVGNARSEDQALLSVARQERSIVGGLPSYDAGIASFRAEVVIPMGARLARNTILLAMAIVLLVLGGVDESWRTPR
jgi:hypothetical protein